MTSVRLRPRAELDLIERTRYYRREGGDAVGARFFDSAVAVLAAVERMPSAGSLRLGELCRIPGLRSRRVSGFPCSWFYLVAADHIDVVRLLAEAQDLPAMLGDDPDDTGASHDP